MTAPPAAPWVLEGESVVGLARRTRPLGALPAGVRGLPGPAVVAAVCYGGSPVGPYLELVVAEPARIGVRAGYCITTMVVDSAESRRAGRLSWGFPKQQGTLTWERHGHRRELRWVERGLAVRGVATPLPLPALVPVRALQHRTDGPVVVPGRLRGLARVARVEVEVEPADGDALDTLAGRHPGVVVSGARLVVRPAREPVGFVSSLRAPLHAPEPALFAGDAALSWHSRKRRGG